MRGLMKINSASNGETEINAVSGTNASLEEIKSFLLQHGIKSLMKMAGRVQGVNLLPCDDYDVRLKGYQSGEDGWKEYRVLVDKKVAMYIRRKELAGNCISLEDNWYSATIPRV